MCIIFILHKIVLLRENKNSICYLNVNNLNMLIPKTTIIIGTMADKSKCIIYDVL